jgi:hypothetical protein
MYVGLDKVSRRRRALFAFVGTFGGIGCAVSFIYLGYEGPLVERVATSLIDFSSTMALLYLAAGVVDRSQVLNKIGDGFRTRRRFRDDDGGADHFDPPRPGE